MPTGLLIASLQLLRVDAVGDPLEAEADVALAELRFAAEVARRQLEVFDLDLDHGGVADLAGAVAGGDDFDRRRARDASLSALAVSRALRAAEDERQRHGRGGQADGRHGCSPRAHRARKTTRIAAERLLCSLTCSVRMSPATELAYRIGAAARRPASWLQLVKFGLVGGSGYLINLAVFALLAGSLGIHHSLAAIGAFCVAVTNNFLWNRHWTFEPGERPGPLPGGPLLRRQPRLAGDQPGRARAPVSGDVVGDLPAQAIAVAIAMPFNFLGNKLWTFA